MLRNEAHLSVIDALPIVSTSYVNPLIAATHEYIHWTINYFHFSKAFGTDPTVRCSAMLEMFELLMYTARHKIIITTPYFVPNEAMQSRLCAAALRVGRYNDYSSDPKRFFNRCCSKPQLLC